MKINKKKLFKEGTSLIVIAVVLAVLVLLNVVVEACNAKGLFDFDLTKDKSNSISKENREYIEAVDKEVEVSVLVESLDSYASYMEYYAENGFHATDQSGEYFDWTAKLIEQYSTINKNIKIKCVDPQGTEFSQTATEYPSENFMYGDILVSAWLDTPDGGTVRHHKVIHFTDIYKTEDTSGMAAMGMDYYHVTGTNIESALTSAIYAVIQEETHTVAILKNHSSASAADDFKSLISTANYDVIEISDSAVTSIPEEADAVALVAPTSDLLGSELDVIAEFLENGGAKGKGFLFFGDTSYQNTPNLYEFLSEWGIGVKQGIVFETSKSYKIFDGDNSTFFSLAVSSDLPALNDIIGGNGQVVTGYNLPLYENGQAYGGRMAYTVTQTAKTAVCAPIGTEKSYEAPAGSVKEQFSTAIVSVDEVYYNNEDVMSYVCAFSSIDFFSPTWTQYTDLGNGNITLNTVAAATGNSGNDIYFDARTVNVDSFIANTTVKGVTTALFVFIVPAAMIALAVIVFVRRRKK